MMDFTARNAVAVTPHDTNASITGSPRALYIGGTGNLACRLSGGSADVTFTGISAGTTLYIEPSHVRSTSTTATAILALYD
jgi:hypothetical protein